MERYRESLLAQGLVDQNWDVVTDIVRGGVSADCREHVLHEAVKACQWECITQLVLQGVSLQHRDMVLKEALRHSQWECATTLVRLGVSANNRDFAFHKAVRYRQWQCVEEVLSLGVSQQQRDFAVRRILRFEQWEFLTELAKAGVCVEQEICSELPEWNSVDELNDITRRLSLEQTKLAMSEVIRQDKWDCVPRLMKLCIHPVVRDSVLRDAVLLGKWDCVTKLVDLGLTEEQRKYVCDEAIVWGQLECAISLLRDGVSSSHTLWIVDESFRQTKWQLLTGLEGWNPTKEAKALLLNTTVTYRQRDAFLDIVQRHGVTDLELTHAMMTAISQSAHAFLHHMIVSTRKGYRVFKQLCLRERWWKVETAVCVHIYLLTVQETDLACYLASAQGMWDSVRNLYGDWRVHARSRHFAFELAVKRGLWEHVVHMVSRGVTRQSDLRFAFLEAIRQRQWCWVMKIVNRDLNLGNSDVRFAVRTCCDECQWDVALDLCQVCDVEVLGVRLAKSVLEHTIRTNALQRFLRLCELWDIAEEPKLLSFILRKALRLQRTDFVTTVIEEFDLYGDDDLEHIAVKSAIDKRNWDFLKELVQREHGGLFTDTLARCIQKMNNRRKQWSKCLPIFEEWCRSYDHFDFIEVMYDTSQRLDMAQAPDLAKWCCVHSLPNIAFIFSIVAAQLPVIKRILKRHKHDIRKEFLAFGFSTACLNGHFEAAFLLLPYLSEEDVDGLVLSGIVLVPLIEKCKDKGMKNWLVHFAMIDGDWDLIERTMDRCQDQILLCKTARDAAIHRKWKLVKSLLVKCSKGTGGTFFSDILKSAIGNGESECVQLVLEKTDPTSAYSGSRTILFDAVTSSEDREGMLRLCVRSGVSTLQRSLETGHYSPMKRALQNGQLPLVRLLHESGSSSNHELFLLKNDASIRTQLERQRRQDIVQYVDQAASNPASLQHLCRLIISHLAGCRPGRRDRVASLPVPWCVQEFLSFADF